MIVNDFNIIWACLRPPKADTVLLIDPDAVLPRSIATKLLKSIARRYSHVIQLRRRIQLIKLSMSSVPELLRAFAPCPSSVLAIIDILGASVAKA